MTHHRVQMTADKLLEAVAPLVADLGSGLPAEELYRRLLQSLRLLLPCLQPHGRRHGNHGAVVGAQVQLRVVHAHLGRGPGPL